MTAVNRTSATEGTLRSINGGAVQTRTVTAGTIDELETAISEAKAEVGQAAPFFNVTRNTPFTFTVTRLSQIATFYYFFFFLSGLPAVPSSAREAALIDCRNGWWRCSTVSLPLLAPTAFFLLIINITYALFDTFAVIDVMVKDKPANNPMTLVYKVYNDGFRGNDIGGSSAQSVILMLVVLVLTLAQFRWLERRVHYG